MQNKTYTRGYSKLQEVITMKDKVATGQDAKKQHRDNQMKKEGYPVVVDAKDNMSKPVKGLPKHVE